MAIMVPKEPRTINKAEKVLFNMLKQHLSSSSVVYHNKEVNGLEFDFCVLLPDMAIVIIEVKGWKETNDIEIKDEVAEIIYRTATGSEQAFPYPKEQSRKYRIELINKVKKQFGVSPLVFDMVCYPNLSKEYFLQKRLDLASGEEWTILKDDMANEKGFIDKIKHAYEIAARNFGGTRLSHDVLRSVRSLYESEEHIKFTSPPDGEPIIPDMPIRGRKYYSILTYIDDVAKINRLMDEYVRGTKLYILTPCGAIYDEVLSAYERKLRELGLTESKGQLIICDPERPYTIDDNDKSCRSNTFTIFNFMVTYPKTSKIPTELQAFEVVDGYLEGNLTTLEWFHDNSGLNLDQFSIEHVGPDKHILVKAGAGTGKTFSMISRLTYLQYINQYTSEEFINEIVMITFTNEAAENMKARLRVCFQNYYMLTRDYMYFEFVELINSMQISTIHSLSKAIIERYSSYLGCGVDVGIVSGNYDREEFLEQELDDFFRTKVEANPDYLGNLLIPMYKLKKILLQLLTRIQNKSTDISSDNLDFMTPHQSIEGKLIHELIVKVLPMAELKYQQSLEQDSKIHLNDLILKLSDLIKINSPDLTGLKVSYLFIDEFQDTDNVQINLMKSFQEKIGFRFFVVGDIKQCIYRFRGAEVAAFDELLPSPVPDTWTVNKLTKNYRTDKSLLAIFEERFLKWASSDPPKLVYNPEEDHLVSDVVKNRGNHEYFKSIQLNDPRADEEVARALISEVERRMNEIREKAQTQNGKLKEKDRMIAILVRENWEAQKIHQFGKDAHKYGAEKSIFIDTDTGGDLFGSYPAIDLYKLVLALNFPSSPKYLLNMGSTPYFAKKIFPRTLYGRSNRDQHTILLSTLDKYIGDCCDNSYINDDTPRTWMGWVDRLKYEPVLRVLRSLINLLSPWDHFALGYSKEEKLTSEAVKARGFYKHNLELLFEKLAQANNTDYMTLNRLETDLRIKITTGQKETTRESYSLGNNEPKIVAVTVHRAKGLEYDTVIVPFGYQRISGLKRNSEVEVIIEGNKVGYRIMYKDKENPQDVFQAQNSFFDASRESTDRMNEETRILYVAMTRAIKNFTYFKYSSKREEQSWQGLLE